MNVRKGRGVHKQVSVSEVVVVVPYGSTYARAAQGAIIRRYLLCDGGRGAARSRPVRLLKQYNNSKKVQSINQCTKLAPLYRVCSVKTG